MDIFSAINFRNHIVQNFRIQHIEGNPSTPYESRIWYDSVSKVPFIRANNINLPLISKDDDFHNAGAITTLDNADELAVWSDDAEPNYRYAKYRKITIENLKSQIASATNAISKLAGDDGELLEDPGADPIFILAGQSYFQTRTIPEEKKMVIEFKPLQANRFLASPAYGADAAPTFRSITIADLPANYGGGGVSGGVVHTSLETIPNVNEYKDGDQWVDPTTLDKFQVYDDGEKKQWVEIHAP